jgi:hypothetical protein
MAACMDTGIISQTKAARIGKSKRANPHLAT